TIVCDLANVEDMARLPKVKNVIFMVGRKFGVAGSEHDTWVTNTVIAGNAAATFRESNIVAFSTGCVYPLVSPQTGGSVETDATIPVGEYGNSCLGRERVFQYFSARYGTHVLLFRLNYAIDMRYGVLLDIAQAVFSGEPVDMSVSTANVIWQGDANNRALLCLEHTANPPAALNVTGPELLYVKDLAAQFAKIFGVTVRFKGNNSGIAYLSNAARSIALFGPPRVSVEQMVQWIANWVRLGGRTLGKPTHFQVTDGQFLAKPADG
ncbi:epimerase, partial [Candidatus Sumerlaeota bacterium]|nr:epimerase [Candidatus Sumerlaeota bacterium]